MRACRRHFVRALWNWSSRVWTASFFVYSHADRAHLLRCVFDRHRAVFHRHCFTTHKQPILRDKNEVWTVSKTIVSKQSFCVSSPCTVISPSAQIKTKRGIVGTRGSRHDQPKNDTPNKANTLPHSADSLLPHNPSFQRERERERMRVREREKTEKPNDTRVALLALQTDSRINSQEFLLLDTAELLRIIFKKKKNPHRREAAGGVGTACVSRRLKLC